MFLSELRLNNGVITFFLHLTRIDIYTLELYTGIYISTVRERIFLPSYIYMQEFTLADLGVFLGVVGGILTSILLTIQKSKCRKIKCCGCECNRDPSFKADEPAQGAQP